MSPLKNFKIELNIVNLGPACQMHSCLCWNLRKKISLQWYEIRRSVLQHRLAAALILTDFLQEFCVRHARTRIAKNSLDLRMGV